MHVCFVASMVIVPDVVIVVTVGNVAVAVVHLCSDVVAVMGFVVVHLLILPVVVVVVVIVQIWFCRNCN